MSVISLEYEEFLYEVQEALDHWKYKAYDLDGRKSQLLRGHFAAAIRDIDRQFDRYDVEDYGDFDDE